MKKTIINVAALFVSVVANRIFPILLFPFLARALGPEHFGRYVQASAFSYLLAQVVEWGFNMTGVRRIAMVAHERAKAGETIANVVLGRSLIMLALLAACALASPWFRLVAPDKTVYWAAVAYGLLFAFDFRFAFYGLQETRAYLMLTFGQYFTSFLLIVAFVKSAPDTWLALVIPACCCLASFAISVLLLRRWADLARPRLSGAVAALKDSVQMFLARNVFQASSQLGVLVLGVFGPAQAVGWLGVNERIVRTVGQLILYPLQIGLTPTIVKASTADGAQAVRVYLLSLALAVGAAAIAGGAVFMGAPFILQLFLGSAPQEAVTVLRWLSIYPVIFVLIHHGGIFWLYLLHWDRENFVILLTYTILFGLTLLGLGSLWHLNGIVLGVLGAGFALVCVYALVFALKRIAPWQRPLGSGLARRRVKSSADSF